MFPVSCGSKHRENEIVNQEDGMVPNIDGGAVIQALQKNVFEETPAEVGRQRSLSLNGCQPFKPLSCHHTFLTEVVERSC